MGNTLKDLIGSVDWRKMLVSGDTRNALVGSALGTALLGGASLMQDRDPEEGKLVPARDALTGAVLGGVAGYALPKGFALFRDAGALAPDGDVLRSNYTGAALRGAGVTGTGFGISLRKTLKRQADLLRENAYRTLPVEQANAQAAVADAIARGASADEIAHWQRRADMLDTTRHGAASDTLARLRRERLSAFFSRDFAKAKALGQEIDALKSYRNSQMRGYDKVWRDLLNRAADEAESAEKGRPLGLRSAALDERAWRSVWNSFRHPLTSSAKDPHFFSHGKHYAAGNLFGIGKTRVGPLGKVGLRGAKYIGLGALIGTIVHRLKGAKSPTNNFKKK